MTKIIDLKDGDEWTGKIGNKEYVIEGDKITMSVVSVTNETLTFEQLANKKLQLEKDIAYRQTTLAEVNARITKLTE